jgi:hypothetical protein
VRYINRIFLHVVSSVISAYFLSACALRSVSLMNVTPLSPDSMVILATMTRNYNGPHDVLNIYVENDGFPNTLTTDPVSGQKDNGITATLWLMVLDHPETYTSFQVKTGQTISFEGYEIKILRMGKEGWPYVELEVNEPEEGIAQFMMREVASDEFLL